MDFSEYQQVSKQTAVSHGLDRFDLDELPRYALGAADEAGELAGAVKKYLRGDYEKEELCRRVKGEVGDQLWYLAIVCEVLGLNLQEVAEHNVRKLQDRHERDKIRGDGDER